MSERKITLVEKLRGRKNDGRSVFYNNKWVFDHKFRLNNHPQNQLLFEEISYTQSTINPLSSVLVIGTSCGRLNLLKTSRFENPNISARVNISPTEEGNICVLNLEWIGDYFHSLANLYYHRWDPVALCHNRRIDLSRFSSTCGPFMDSTVNADGNLCLLAGYPGIFALDFRSRKDLHDLSGGFNFPRKINCVQFSRSGAHYGITHVNPSCCLSVYDMRKSSEPLHTLKIEDKLKGSYPNSIFWGPSDDFISFTALCEYAGRPSWARLRLQDRFSSQTPVVFFYRKNEEKAELECFDSITLDNWGKDSLGPFAQKVQLLGKKYFGLAGSRSTQIFRLSDRTLYQDLKQGKHTDRICGIEYIEGDRSLITYDDLGDIFRWKKTIESVADLTSYS
ncbi:unnamed protein product [Oikopleura dioica]|uniref:DUF2415 domain-containing protein n=1 Tax=Oikopleura dioica TaxID=34765 RepID=E4XRQ9_OIKDI|nr:unnamed protein product [Oikopleura dioica]